MTSWRPVEAHRHLGVTYAINLWDRRISLERKQQEAGGRCCFLAWLTLQPWRWSQYILPKQRWTSDWPYGVISQNIVLFKVNLILYCCKEWREFKIRPTFFFLRKNKVNFYFLLCDFKEKLSLKSNVVGPLKRYFSHLFCKRLRKKEYGMGNTIKQILPSSYFARPVELLQSCHVWFSVYLTKLPTFRSVRW
jgi:hypothetical protein